MIRRSPIKRNFGATSEGSKGSGLFDGVTAQLAPVSHALDTPDRRILLGSKPIIHLQVARLARDRVRRKLNP